MIKPEYPVLGDAGTTQDVNRIDCHVLTHIQPDQLLSCTKQPWARFRRRARGYRFTIRIAHAYCLSARPGHQGLAIRAAGPADTAGQQTSNEIRND